MFLSRVEIAWESARNPYQIHRRLWRLFPGEGKETRSNGDQIRYGFLFRIEECRPGRPARLLVQSRQAPQDTSGLDLIGIREFHARPSAGQRLAFLLTANPVKAILDTERDTKPDKRSEKCRVPLIREDEQRTWLDRKLTGAASAEAVSILLHGPIHFRKGARAGKLIAVTYEGVLKVEESNTLSRLLENGIGPAKAFGCGLLLVRRLR